MKEGKTKEAILDAAEKIILGCSFHSVGLNQILKTVNVPKGSFYYYFNSKEHFGVELLRHYAERESSLQRRRLIDDKSIENPSQRLITFFKKNVECMNMEGRGCSCLIQKLASEVSFFSDLMRVELAAAYTKITNIFEEVLSEAQEYGSLAEDVDVDYVAACILDIWSGAQQRALVFQSNQPLIDGVKSIERIVMESK